MKLFRFNKQYENSRRELDLAKRDRDKSLSRFRSKKVAYNLRKHDPANLKWLALLVQNAFRVRKLEQLRSVLLSCSRNDVIHIEEDKLCVLLDPVI